MTQYDWRAGQEVTILHNGDISAIQKICRLTRTLVVLDNGSRYRIKDGCRVGYEDLDLLRCWSIRPATDRDRLVILRAQLLDQIMHKTRWGFVSTEALQNIKDRIEDDLRK